MSASCSAALLVGRLMTGSGAPRAGASPPSACPWRARRRRCAAPHWRRRGFPTAAAPFRRRRAARRCRSPPRRLNSTTAEAEREHPSAGPSRKISARKNGVHGASKKGSMDGAADEVRAPAGDPGRRTRRPAPLTRAAASAASSRSARTVSSHQRPRRATATAAQPLEDAEHDDAAAGDQRQIEQRLDAEREEHAVEDLQHIERRNEHERVQDRAQAPR